jgi:CRISPR system Cascade subunit CasA
MSTFNALDEPWILVRWRDGTVCEIGIREATLRAHEIAELADASPLVVVTQLRLLLAILYRVVGEFEWDGVWASGRLPEAKLNAYFDQWRDRFELFGDRPFMQVGGDFAMNGDNHVAKLAPEIDPTEYNRLFSHMNGNTPANLSPADSLRILLVAQSCALGGGISGNPFWNGATFTRPNFGHASVASGMILWLAGDSLFETLMLNLSFSGNSSPDDKPVWERDLTPAYFPRAVPDGPMDRYVILSRMIRLLPETDAEGKTVVRRMYYTQGRAIDKAQPDPMQCYRQTKKGGMSAVLISETKATWRDLSALLQLNRDGGIRAACLNFVGTMVNEGVVERRKTLNLHIAGMASDKAKVLLWRHDKVSLPAAFLENEKLVSVLTARLQNAEETAILLWKRIRTVCWHFYAPVKDMMSPDTKNVSALAQQIDSRRTFWARIEGHLPELLQRIADAGANDTSVEKWWTQIINDAATEAQTAAVERLGPSPRAWRAAASIPPYFSNRRENN